MQVKIKIDKNSTLCCRPVQMESFKPKNLFEINYIGSGYIVRLTMHMVTKFHSYMDGVLQETVVRDNDNCTVPFVRCMRVASSSGSCDCDLLKSTFEK